MTEQKVETLTMEDFIYLSETFPNTPVPAKEGFIANRLIRRLHNTINMMQQKKEEQLKIKEEKGQEKIEENAKG